MDNTETETKENTYTLVPAEVPTISLSSSQEKNRMPHQGKREMERRRRQMEKRK
jgi:hypothetical protein